MNLQDAKNIEEDENLSINDDGIQPDEESEDTSENEVEESVITFDGKNLSDDEDDDLEEEESETDDEEPQDENAQQDGRKKSPRWVRKLRKDFRKAQKENWQLKRQLESKLQEPKNEAIELKEPVRPKISEFDYDEDKYDKALQEYEDKKIKFVQQKSKKDRELEEQQKLYDSKIDNYRSKKSTLKVKDYKEAEQEVIDHLPKDKQNMILFNAENPELVVYALGKNHELLDQLSRINDPIKFGYEMAKVESRTAMTSQKKRPTAKPEKTIKETAAGISNNSTKRLDKVYQDGLKSRDMTEYFKALNKLNAG